MREVVELPSAGQDIKDILNDLVDRENSLLALKFIDALREAYEDLSSFPEIGAIREFKKAETLRLWCLTTFKNYLLFYRVTETKVEIVRILHGARNVDAIFHDDDLHPN